MVKPGCPGGPTPEDPRAQLPNDAELTKMMGFLEEGVAGAFVD